MNANLGTGYLVLGASRLTVAHANVWNRSHKRLSSVSMWGRGGRRGVGRGGEKEGGRDTDMQSLGCHLAFSVRAVRAGKNGRLSTDVVQSDEERKTILPLVSDDDDGGHTWRGDTDFLSMVQLMWDGGVRLEFVRDVKKCNKKFLDAGVIGQLASVSAIVDEGNVVVFGAEESYIEHTSTGQRIPCEQEAKRVSGAAGRTNGFEIVEYCEG